LKIATRWRFIDAFLQSFLLVANRHTHNLQPTENITISTIQLRAVILRGLCHKAAAKDLIASEEAWAFPARNPPWQRLSFPSSRSVDHAGQLRQC
jgi:hypothetical protein